MKKILLLLAIISIALTILVQKANQLETTGKVILIKNFDESRIIVLEDKKEILIMSKEKINIKENDKIRAIGIRSIDGKKEKIIATKIYKINDS